MLQRVILVVLSLPFVITLAAYLLPNSTEVSRTIVIDRPAVQVFPMVNNLRNMQQWSPWAEKDPKMKLSYSGAEQGVGAKMHWQSENKAVGVGNQEIVSSEMNKQVVLTFAFENQPPADVRFQLDKAQENKTRLTWRFLAHHGKNPISRYVGLMFDSLLGPEMEKGLSNLKQIVEQQPTQTKIEDTKQGVNTEEMNEAQ